MEKVQGFGCVLLQRAAEGPRTRNAGESPKPWDKPRLDRVRPAIQQDAEVQQIPLSRVQSHGN